MVESPLPGYHLFALVLGDDLVDTSSSCKWLHVDDGSVEVVGDTLGQPN